MNSSVINMHKNDKQGKNITSFKSKKLEGLNHDDIFKLIDKIDAPEYQIDTSSSSSELTREPIIMLEGENMNEFINDLVKYDSLPQFFHNGKCLISLSDLLDLKVLKYDDVFVDDSDEPYDESEDPFQMGWKDRETITIIDSKNKTSDQIYFEQRARVIETVIESHKNSMSDDNLNTANNFVRYILRKTDLPRDINFYNEKNADLLYVAFAITQEEAWGNDPPIQESEFAYCLYFPGKCDLEECRICKRIIFLIKFTSSKNSRDAIPVTKIYITMMRNSLENPDESETQEIVSDTEESTPFE